MSKSKRIIVGHGDFAFSAQEIETYERDILLNDAATEHDASRFFETHPKFICLGQASEIRREIILGADAVNRPYRVDFFRKNFGRSEWDIVELKHPGKPFFSGIGSNHPRAASMVTSAISQAHDYRDFIINNPSVRSELSTKGINVYRPKIVVVAGQFDSAIDPERLSLVYERLQTGIVDILSYTDILLFAKEHYKSHGTILVPVMDVAQMLASGNVNDGVMRLVEFSIKDEVSHLEERKEFPGKHTGEVARLLNGFGFMSSVGMDDLFFHSEGLEDVSFGCLSKGDAMQFIIEKGRKGPIASEVSRV